MHVRSPAFPIVVPVVLGLLFLAGSSSPCFADHIRDLQTSAAKEGKAAWGHWGTLPEKYSSWTSHSNRLIPVYTFGASLQEFKGAHSPYRSEERLRNLYGAVPRDTLNPQADYFDQTDIFRLQQRLAKSGKKHLVLFVFDGMDWQTTWAAAIHRAGRVGYREGRGTGMYFQDYRGAETDYGYFVTSPHNDGTNSDVNSQTVINPGGTTPGGYDWRRGGSTPWDRVTDPPYLLAKSRDPKHAYTDSSSSASSLTAGIKTYNNAVNVDYLGKPVPTIAHELQAEGWSIGVVTSVPISHATPACAYSHNVDRDDYQDLTRDLIGLRSVSHKDKPLPGVDVLIGCGWGEVAEKDPRQGDNYVPGNRYLTADDLQAIDADGTAPKDETPKYRIAQRTPDQSGREVLLGAADDAAKRRLRLLGYFGARGGHLPFQTADGKYDPTENPGGKRETYSDADVRENPTLADMSRAALRVLEKNPKGFWLMIEAGDVDWANHANNLDNSIGAVLSGDEAFRAVVEWVEARQGWNDTAVILTADHGHYLVLEDPAALLPKEEKQ